MSITRVWKTTCAAAVCTIAAAGAFAGEPAFVKKPVVAKTDTGYSVSFEADQDCDVTVGIIDKDGTVVRHLVAGMLGGKAHTLSWDGNDDFGKPVGAGSTVRVDLGLSVTFKRMLCEVPQGVSSRGPVGMAVDDKGTLYIMEGHLSVGKNMMEMKLKAFDREGNYLRTLYPYPADLPAEKISMVEFITTKDGRRVPLSGFGGHRVYSGFIPGNPGTVRHTPAITGNGKYLFVTGTIVAGARRILRMGTDGSVTLKEYPGPELHDQAKLSEMFLTLSPDEKTLYYAGAISKRGGKTHAVYRVNLATDAQAAPFIGTPFETGDDEKHFNDPRGLATDAKGRIYVGDYANNRIQVFEANGSFVKSLSVTSPEQVLVHPTTGAVYVFSVKDRGSTNTYTKKIQWEI
ncbi:hypothetical protein ACFL01_02635, partial [Planctomycetota bacterium]